MIIVDTENITKYIDDLCNPECPIAERVDSLFCLRSFKELEAIDGLIKAFHTEKKSELLLHEICYCLGQMNDTEAHVAKIVPFLEMIISNESYPQIVIHEAVEALANMDDYSNDALLARFENSEHSEMVKETVDLARGLIEWNQKTDKGRTEGIDLGKMRIKTNDPAPPFDYWGKAEYRDVANLTQILLDPSRTCFDRNRALFTLRELNSKESVLAICQTLRPENFDKCSALLKHEVAFVLAQMEDVFKHAVPFLIEACLDPREASIVKHEGLVAVGEMIDDAKEIEHLLQHEDPIVSESCAVAINNMKNRLAE